MEGDERTIERFHDSSAPWLFCSLARQPSDRPAPLNRVRPNTTLSLAMDYSKVTPDDSSDVMNIPSNHYREIKCNLNILEKAAIRAEISTFT